MARHRAAIPKLDAIRQSVMAASRPGAVLDNSPATTLFQTLWRELVLPSRRLWSGLAAVWLLIVLVNVSQRDHSSATRVFNAPAMMSLHEQQRWMNELFADRAQPVDAEPPKTFSPKPRTETASFFTT